MEFIISCLLSFLLLCTFQIKSSYSFLTSSGLVSHSSMLCLIVFLGSCLACSLQWPFRNEATKAECCRLVGAITPIDVILLQDVLYSPSSFFHTIWHFCCFSFNTSAHCNDVFIEISYFFSPEGLQPRV